MRGWEWGAAGGALRGTGGHTGEAAANLRTAGRGRPIAGAQVGVLARTQQNWEI